MAPSPTQIKENEKASFPSKLVRKISFGGAQIEKAPSMGDYSDASGACPHPFLLSDKFCF
jgi:hypothetical protein